MLQWMGGSRRNVTTSRKSTQKRQKQYFEQRKQQQQQQHNSSGLESYSDKKIPCRPCHENNRSLDVLCLLNLSKNGQDLNSRFPEGSGSLKGEHATPNYETSYGPNTIQMEIKNLCPSEYVEIRETRIVSNHLEETVCAQEFLFDCSSSSHPDASKRNDDKDPKKMTIDHIDHNLSVVDMLGDDGQNISCGGSFVHEDHVAFSVEGLGKVGMETPVHSPQQPTRNFPYGCPTPSKISMGSLSTKNLNCTLEDQFPELDDMAVDVDIPTDECSLEPSPYFGELYGNLKPKIMVSKKSLRHDLKDFLSNDRLYDSRVEQDGYKWNEKSSFLDDRFLDDNCGLSWKNWPCDLDSSMVNHMRSWKPEKPDFSFEGLHMQKRRGGAKAAGSFNISELPSTYKHQMKHGYDFMTSNITSYPTIGSYCEFSEMIHCSAWHSFATEDARDCLSLSSEDSCLSQSVWQEGTKNPSFNSTERRKRRGHEAYFRSPVSKFSTKKNTFTQELCTKRLNTWQQESVICSGMHNRMSDFSTPGDDWLFGEQCNIENTKLGYPFMNASETQKASSFGCKHWTKDPLDSDFNPKLYVDDKPSASRSKHDAFGGNFFSDNVVSQQVSPGHSSPVLPNINVEHQHWESYDGLFKEKKDSPKIQFQERVSTGENKSATLQFIGSMVHQHEDNCHQSNYSFSTNGTPMNVSDSKDDHSHFEESKVKTPEMTPCPNAVLSPVRSEGGSSSVEMPQKLEDCDGLKEGS